MNHQKLLGLSIFNSILNKLKSFLDIGSGRGNQSSTSVGTVTSVPDVNFLSFYKIGTKIGNGNFGDIYVAKDLKSRERVAIKMEPINCKYPQIMKEYRFYKSLTQHIGFPKIFLVGHVNNQFNALAMELLGPSLDYLFRLCADK